MRFRRAERDYCIELTNSLLILAEKELAAFISAVGELFSVLIRQTNREVPACRHAGAVAIVFDGPTKAGTVSYNRSVAYEQWSVWRSDLISHEFYFLEC